MRDPNQGDVIVDPVELLAKLLESSCDSGGVNRAKLHRLLDNHWNRVSKLAHAVHAMPPPLPEDLQKQLVDLGFVAIDKRLAPIIYESGSAIFRGGAWRPTEEGKTNG